MGELVVLINNTNTVVVYLKKQGGTVFKVMCDLAQEIVRSGTGDSALVRTLLGGNLSEIYPRENEYLGGSVESP